MENLENPFEVNTMSLFNSPFEVGLRALFLLNEVYPAPLSLSRLVAYDYFLLNSHDFDLESRSIHPAIPHRSMQLLIRPKITARALLLMRSKELVVVNFDNQGISYCASELTSKFLSFFENQYSQQIKQSANLVSKKFSKLSDEQLSQFIDDNFSKWGSEFIYESLFR